MKEQKSEIGSSTLEMAVIIPLAVLFIAVIASFGPWVHITFAVEQAAYDCAVSAAHSLDPERAYSQGLSAGEQSFSRFGLDMGRFHLALSGNWDRTGKVKCQAAYSVPVEKFPIKGMVSIPGQYTYSVEIPVQYWKSEWE